MHWMQRTRNKMPMRLSERPSYSVAGIYSDRIPSQMKSAQLIYPKSDWSHGSISWSVGNSWRISSIPGVYRHTELLPRPHEWRRDIVRNKSTTARRTGLHKSYFSGSNSISSSSSHSSNSVFTSWFRLQQRIVQQLVKEMSASCGNRRFATVFTESRNQMS
jgi:hypothetical protein